MYALQSCQSGDEEDIHAVSDRFDGSGHRLLRVRGRSHLRNDVQSNVGEYFVVQLAKMCTGFLQNNSSNGKEEGWAIKNAEILMRLQETIGNREEFLANKNFLLEELESLVSELKLLKRSKPGHHADF